MKTGPTIKKIRQLKGITQKETYGDIVSRSFINRFEKGIHDISAGKLFKILKNISVTAEEFEFFSNDYQESDFNKYIYIVNELYQKRSFLALSKWAQKQKESANPNNDLKLAIGYAELLMLGYNHFHIPMDQYIKYFIINTYNHKQWTLQEIKVADMLFPIEDQRLGIEITLPKITDKMERSCQMYHKNEQYYLNAIHYLISFYGTSLQDYLNHNQIPEAKQLIHKLNQIDEKLLKLDDAMTLYFLKLLWGLYFTNYEENKQKIEQFLSVIENLSIEQRSFFQKVYQLRKMDAKARNLQSNR